MLFKILLYVLSVLALSKCIIAQSITLQVHLNNTLAAVQECNEKLNITATVYILKNNDVLIQVPFNVNDNSTIDEVEDEYSECLSDLDLLVTFSLFTDSVDEFSNAHGSQMVSADDWLAKRDLEDVVIATPLDEINDPDSSILYKRLANQRFRFFSSNYPHNDDGDGLLS